MKKLSALTLLLAIACHSHAQSFTESNLPIIVINTSGQSIPDEPKITATMGIINGGGSLNQLTDPFTDYSGNIGIETRGNSTQGYDKKTYSIELRTSLNVDTSVSLLGMPSEEDWILHGMVIDKSLIRIPMSFYFMQKMGHYAARWRFVEVMLNNEYQGVYVLTESIKRDNDRVDINKLTPADVNEADITGGYILRIDWDDGEGEEGFPTGFDSQYKSVGGPKQFYQYHYPKEELINEPQKAYIKDFMDQFENALFSDSKYNGRGKHYSQYIDLTSFADFIIINEISRNSDGYKLSSYVHKYELEAGNKMHAGPMWDFDQTYGMSTVCGCNETDGWNYTQEHPACEDYTSLPQWYRLLMNDPLFQNHIKCRWEEHRAGVFHKDSINAWIDQNVANISEAKDRNFVKWNFIGEEIWSEPHPFPETYNEEISWMKKWISDRIDWLDTHMPGNCADDVVTKIEDSGLNFNIYPNPTTQMLTIALAVYYEGMTYQILDMQGKVVAQDYAPTATFQLDLGNLKEGVYVIQMQGVLGSVRRRFVKS